MPRDEKLIRIPGESLMIEETNAEIKYRKKHFSDFKDVTGKKLSCTVCNKNISRYIFSGKEIFIHNILGVLVCQECHSFYGDGCFSMDEDGDDKYCRWCGQGGTLYCCARCSCAFCKKCIKSNLNRSVLDDVEKDDWECFVCEPEPLYAVRCLCWAASKYYDHINENKSKAKKKEKENEKSDDDQKSKRKRHREDDSEDSVERKRNKLEILEKKEKPKISKKEESDNDSSSEDKSSRNRRSKVRKEDAEKKKSKKEMYDNESSDDKPLRRKAKLSHVSKRDSSESSVDRKKKSKRKESSSDESSEDKRAKPRRRLQRNTAQKSTKQTSSSESDESVERTKIKKNMKRNSKKRDSSQEKSLKKTKKQRDSSDDEKLTKKQKKQIDSSEDEKSTKNAKKEKDKKNVLDAKTEKKKKTKASDDEPDKSIDAKYENDKKRKAKTENKKRNKSSDDEPEDKSIDSDNDKKRKAKTENKKRNKASDSEPDKSIDSENDKNTEKKILKLSQAWLTESLKDICVLARLMIKKSDQIKGKNLKSINDVTIAFSRMNKMVTGISDNITYIEEVLRANNIKFRKLNGEEVKSEQENEESKEVTVNHKEFSGENEDELERKEGISDDKLNNKTNKSPTNHIEVNCMEVDKTCEVNLSSSVIGMDQSSDESKGKSVTNKASDKMILNETSEENNSTSSINSNPNNSIVYNTDLDDTNRTGDELDENTMKKSTKKIDSGDKSLGSEPIDDLDKGKESSKNLDEESIKNSTTNLDDDTFSDNITDNKSGKDIESAEKSSKNLDNEDKSSGSETDDELGKNKESSKESSKNIDNKDKFTGSETDDELGKSKESSKESFKKSSENLNNDDKSSGGETEDLSDKVKESTKKSYKNIDNEDKATSSITNGESDKAKELNTVEYSPDVTDEETTKEKKNISDAVLRAQNELLKSSSSDISTSEELDSDKNDVDFSTKKKRFKKKSKKAEQKDDDEKESKVTKVKQCKTKKDAELESGKEESDTDDNIDKLTDLSRLETKKKKKKKDSNDESDISESEHKEDNEKKSEDDVEEKEVEEKAEVDTGVDRDEKIPAKSHKKKEEEDILEFLNKKEYSSSSDDIVCDFKLPFTSDSERELELSKEKEKALEKEKEDFDLKLLIASSDSEGDNKKDGKSDDSALENILLSLDEKKKKKTKEKDGKGKTEDKMEEEDKKEEENDEYKLEKNNEENKSDENESSYNSSDDVFQQELKKKKKKWREDRLLKVKLSETDTSDEDRKWKKLKERKAKKKKEDEEGLQVKGKRKKNVVVDSDDEEEKKEGKDKDTDSLSSILLSESSSSESEEIFRKVKRKKSSSSAISISSSSDEKKKVMKKKRRRIKSPKPDDESTDSEEEQVQSQKSTVGESPGKGGRKNIRKVFTKDDLAEATKLAAKEEEERKKRIAERQKWFNEMYEMPDEVQALDKLVLDFDPETKEELISVHKALVAKMKPHQAKGVKFMWDSCFESVAQLKTKKGSGCILAHCMGLGKTFQVVSLVHTVMTHEATNVKNVLVVCPLSTVLNWCNEFEKWLKDVDDDKQLDVYHLTVKQNFARARQLKDWHDDGGVMILGYDMFRNLSADTKKFRVKIKEMLQTSLIDPGPDLIVCDEGHMLKNEATALSKAMTKVRTRRRIVLTGTPLQNNLKEYHCMVQFVKPNLLGTRKEFLNRFVNPITNGQFVDSTEHDVRVMKKRAHVLHKMLEGLIQRYDYGVLTPFLPPKHEYVILLRLSEVQIKLYQYYLDHFAQGGGAGGSGSRLFNDFQCLSRIWTHPHAVKMSTEKADRDAQKKADLEEDSEGSLKDFIDDSDAETSSSSSKSSKSSEGSEGLNSDGESKKNNSNARSTRSTRNNPIKENEEEETEETKEEKKAAWWTSIVEPEQLEDINQSAKFVLLFAILRECSMIGDKVLVFSQSLYSLNLIEYFLEKIDTANSNSVVDPSLGSHVGSWTKGLDYFRLDGASSSENRNLWCRFFNNESNTRARLFLISTRAGGLGINLVGANRVIIFDASWNPSHDVQSIFRIYRFGQKKPCYIYRFIAQGTMEEKVYDRQVAKLSLSSRVVDEQQAHRHFSHNDLQELYTFTPKTKTERPVPLLPKDKLMAELLKECDDWIEAYHEHDSLIEHVIDEELDEEERKAAWEEYEKEKERGFPGPGPGVNNPIMNFGNNDLIRQSLAKKYPAASEEEMNRMLNAVLYQMHSNQLQQHQRQLLQMQQQQFFQQQLKAQTAASAQFPQVRPSVAHQVKPFGITQSQIPFNKLNQQQVYNYKAQLAYQKQLQSMTNRFPTPKTDAGAQKPKSDADSQIQKNEENKNDPEVVNLE